MLHPPTTCLLFQSPSNYSEISSSSSTALCPIFKPRPLHCGIFETTEIIQGQDVSYMPNPQQEGPAYLSLSGNGGSTSN